MRKTVTAILAWTTLIGGACFLNALTGMAIHLVLAHSDLEPGSVTYWKLLAVVFSLLGPCWVLVLLAWFREKGSVG